ncbi:MAG: hypothetical protein E6G08_10125 [Actinobacteria bacterium]|nr:MAG: hypothetical protein E6G08_10125 [Actinomycetota bacterium]
MTTLTNVARRNARISRAPSRVAESHPAAAFAIQLNRAVAGLEGSRRRRGVSATAKSHGGTMKGTLHTQRLGRLFFAAATFVLLVAGALIGAPAAAADTAVSETTAFTYTADNLCTGELISGTGNMHFLLHENLSANGAIEHYLDVHIDGLKAIGMPSGKTYIVQDVYSDEFVIAGATEETFDITAHFIRQGEDGTLILGDDFYEYMRTHITANANGMVTAFSIRTNDMPCQ